MAREKARRSVIVADRRPLERGLARFLLEERGLFVVGEAATMADVLLQVQQLKPDLVVLHEKLALDHDPTVIAQVRRISPKTRIILLASDADNLPPALALLAQTIVVDGPGLTQLGEAVAGPLPVVEPIGPTVRQAGDQPEGEPGNDTYRRWSDRLQGMAVASIIAFAFLFARSVVLSPSTSPSTLGRVHLSAAYQQLDELQAALPMATPETVAQLAQVLIDERARAEEAGADVSELDQAIYDTLIRVWPSLPPDTQSILLALLGGFLPPDATPTIPAPTSTTPVPSPEPSPDAVAPAEAGISPTESPPIESPSPTTESPLPTTEPPTTTTESPSPTTESPSPTTDSPSSTTESVSTSIESQSPANLTTGGETRSGVLLIPPAIVLLLLTGTGVARRKAVRGEEEPPADPEP
ncbi:MAG TPA: hypothetical protein VKC55_04750 [Actinomycetota bacterium]|nr:hypothetical protein [Actinomycetota bacterium]